MCGHGERAMGAASLLTRAGHTDLVVLEGSAQDWSKESTLPLVSDSMPVETGRWPR